MTRSGKLFLYSRIMISRSIVKRQDAHQYTKWIKKSLTLYRPIAAKSMVNGTAVAAIACVDGNPYSASTLVSSLNTGGQVGRGHLSRSLAAWPRYLNQHKRVSKEMVTLPLKHLQQIKCFPISAFHNEIDHFFRLIILFI